MMPGQDSLSGAQGGDRRIFFDISSMRQYIRTHDRYSGIQRVVAMVAHQTAGLIDPGRVYLCYVSHGDGRFYCLSLDQIERDALLDPLALRGVFFSRFVNLAHLRQFRNLGLRAAKGVVAALRSTPVRALPGRVQAWVTTPKARRAATRPAPRPRPVDFDSLAREGDVLALLDCAWFPLYARAFARAKGRGVQVYTMVHDLIPLIMGAATSDDEP